MNASRVRLLEEHPSHYVLHDGTAPFRVPKAGLSEDMHRRIQAFAEGGAVESYDVFDPKKSKETGGAEYETQEFRASEPTVRREVSARNMSSKPSAENVNGRTVAHRPAPRPESPAARFARAVSERMRGAATMVGHREAGGSAASGASAAANPPHKPQADGEDLSGQLEVQRAHGGRIPGYAEGGGVSDGGDAGGYNQYDPMALPERRDNGPVVYVSPQPVPGTVPVQIGGAGGGGGSDTGGSGGGPGWYGPGTVARPDMGSGGAEGGASGNETPPNEAAAMQANAVSAPTPVALPPKVVPRGQETTTVKPPQSSPVVASRQPVVATGPDAGREFATATAEQKAAAEAEGVAKAQMGVDTARALADARTQLERIGIEEKEKYARAREATSEMMGQHKQMLDEMRKVDTSVDPGRFWASRTTSQKVLGIIGLALGAIGSKDGVNRSAQMLSQAIDRDIEAQKAETEARLRKGAATLSASQQMYAMNRQLFQDDIAATAASKVTAIELVQNQLQQVAATASSPIAKAQAAALSGQLDAAKAKFDEEAKLRTEELNIKRQANAIDAAKVAAGAGTDKDALHTAQAVRERANDIRNNLAKAESLIKRSGTFELMGADQPDLQDALGTIATDMAKLKDPNSAARPSEVEEEQKLLGFKAGTLTTSNATAIELLRRYRNAVDRREQEALKVRGFLR